LVLTDVGWSAYQYAEEIFDLGQKLLDLLKGRPTGYPSRHRVGVVDVVPKLVPESFWSLASLSSNRFI
jgi:LysR family transcriptional activator of nhaA